MFVTPAEFCCVYTPTMTNFKVPNDATECRVWKKYRVGSPEPGLILANSKEGKCQGMTDKGL